MSKRGRKYVSEERYREYLAAKDSFTRREIRREMYRNYLLSDAWKKKRTQVRDRARGVCEECKYNDGSDAHHLTYQRIFAESLVDLVWLCRACHTKHHELKGTKYGHRDELIWTPDMFKRKANKPAPSAPPAKTKDQLSLFP